MSEDEVAYQANNKEPNMVAAGFHKLEKGLIKKRPPKILWGKVYLAWPAMRKINYLEKFASSMNHAAFLIQGERNQLLEICKNQEVQLASMTKRMDANNAMVQDQITKMNAERQEFNKAAAAMKKQLRELESGSVD